MLQAAGDRPLFFKEDDGHPGCTRGTGVEDALILPAEKDAGMLHVQKMTGIFPCRLVLHYHILIKDGIFYVAR